MTNPVSSLDDLARALTTPEMSERDHADLSALSPDEFVEVVAKARTLADEVVRETRRETERWCEAHPDQTADFAACPSEAADRLIAFYTDDSEPVNGEGRAR